MKNILIFFILLIASCCTSHEEIDITSLHEFSDTLHLKGQENHVVSDKYKSPLLAVVDSFLIIYDPHVYSSLLSIHDKRTLKKIADYGFIGRGPREIARKGFWYVDAWKGIIYIQDAVKKKIFRFQLDTAFCVREIHISLNRIIIGTLMGQRNSSGSLLWMTRQ